MTATRSEGHALKADAKNRAWRTLLQGLGFSVAAALVVTLFSAVTTATSWGELGATVIGFSFFQSVAVAGLSWLMRTYIDRSKVPTPLPLADPGEPRRRHRLTDRPHRGQHKSAPFAAMAEGALLACCTGLGLRCRTVVVIGEG